MLVPLIACLVVLLALGVVERLARDRAWASIPIRVHVNGTRGKSTVTRLVWSALREAGIPALAKTTGTAARVLLPDGREEPLTRRGPASIREQLACLRRARRIGARAVVLECMALDPALQHVSERRMVRATVGVVTNVRFDHDEIMGHDVETIASTLANTIPPGAVLVTGPGSWVPILRSRATAVGARVVVAGESEDYGELRRPATWIGEDQAVALAVTRELGIDDRVALEAFARAPQDPGSVTAGRLALAAGDADWLDATAANDPESLALLLASAWDQGSGIGDQGSGIGDRSASHETGPRILLYQHRADRASRLAAFAARSAALAGADHLVITGARPPWTVWRRLVAARPGRPPQFVPPSELAGWLRANAAGSAIAFCGNTRGLDVPRLLEEAVRRD